MRSAAAIPTLPLAPALLATPARPPTTRRRRRAPDRSQRPHASAHLAAAAVAQIRSVMEDFARVDARWSQLGNDTRLVRRACDERARFEADAGARREKEAALARLAETAPAEVLDAGKLSIHPFLKMLAKKSAAAQGAAGADDDDIQAVGEAINPLTRRCPITAGLLVDPVQCNICDHVYERAAIFNFLEKATAGKKVGCPEVGCANRDVTKASLKDYSDFTYAKEREARRREKRKREAGDADGAGGGAAAGAKRRA
jgi:hypothetical protein